MSLCRHVIGERSQRDGDVWFVSQLSEYPQALLLQSMYCRIIALVKGDTPQIVERLGDTLLVSQLLPYRQALLVSFFCCLVVALFTSQIPQVAEGGGDTLLVSQLPLY